MVSRREPELIDLDSSDDEITDEISVIVLDESDITNKEEIIEVRPSPSISSLDKDSQVKNLLPTKSLFTVTSTASCSIKDDSNSSQGGEKNSSSNTNLDDSDITVVEFEKPNCSSWKSMPTNVNRDIVSNFLNNIESENKSSSNVIIDDFVDIVFDSVKQSAPKSLHSNTGDVLKDSNKQRKRKRKLGLTGVKNVEVVEIPDDDIIVVTDSTILLEPSVINPCSELNKELKSAEVSSQSGGSSSKNDNYQHLPHPDTNQLACEQKTSENECSVDNFQNSGPPKKKSKLAYHRPAHLVTPLTLPASSVVPAAKVDSVSNIYNPNADSIEKRTGLRPIVIDGNNVGIGHGKGKFSLKGIKICVNFFEKRGHRQIKVFIPQYRRNRDNHDELQTMERKGLIVITPSRRVNGKVVASYDDRYIVQYAAEFGGVIVSTDNYRDLLIENPSWRDTIENRLLMFTWVDDLLMFPQDPLGRKGPSLDDFLKFPDT